MADLWPQVKSVLKERDLFHSERCSLSPRSADVAASGDSKMLLRLSQNIDSVSKREASSMKSAAEVIGAEAMIIGERGHKLLCDQAIYERYSVMAMTPEALGDYLDGEPLCLAERGGFKFEIENLKALRESAGFSRGQLARRLGVSVTMVRKYEDGSSPSPTTAKRLVDLFGSRVLKKPEPPSSDLMAAFPNSAPFELVLRSSSLFLVSEKDSKERIDALFSFADALDGEPVVLGEAADWRELLESFL